MCGVPVSFISIVIIFWLTDALTQTVVCLPLLQRVWGSIPGEVENFIMKNFKLWTWEGWTCATSNR